VLDIEVARERSVRELNIRLSILRGNLLSLKRRVENEQAKAADIERRGKQVPEALQQVIDETQAEISATEAAIDARKVEIDDVKEAYQRDIERFRYITEELGYRRR
jgi:chromosome segregation ATPase